MYLSIMKLQLAVAAQQENQVVKARELVRDLKEYVSGNWNLTEIQKVCSLFSQLRTST